MSGYLINCLLTYTTAKIKYVDQTADLVKLYRHDLGDTDDDHESVQAEPEPTTTSAFDFDQSPEACFGPRHYSPASLWFEGAAGIPERVPESFSQAGNGTLLSPPSTNTAQDSTQRPCGSFMAGLVKPPSTSSIPLNTAALEVVLLRYFIDILARCFDLCDPDKHFELVVPYRARWCPALRNAILASSARHFMRVHNFGSDSNQAFCYEGIPLPNLNEETALRYHSECIKELLERSLNPDQIHDPDLFAAAIILRFYEEIDAPLRNEDGDSELFLRVMNVFIDAQIPSVPLFVHDLPLIGDMNIDPADRRALHASTASSDGIQTQSAMSPAATTPNRPVQTLLSPYGPSRWRPDGLSQAAFWVAFRQEIHSAFLKQRPFNIALSRCEAIRGISPANDAIWADRLVIFCADVLEFCYGNVTNLSQHRSNMSAKDRWLDLKAGEKMWSEALPASFEPIYFRDPDRWHEEVFPQICYLADCHVIGVQHLELAKILLTAYDPTWPMLALGYAASTRTLSAELRMAVLRLCGIALSNRKTRPGLVMAYLGIAMCGDHFDDITEQKALIGVLDELESSHAWPVGNLREALKEIWGWDGSGG